MCVIWSTSEFFFFIRRNLCRTVVIKQKVIRKKGQEMEKANLLIDVANIIVFTHYVVT